MRPLKKPIYVTQPALPKISRFKKKLKRIWKSKQLSNNGKEVTALESRLSDYLGVPHVSVLVNGTIALQLAIKALHLSGEVITTPFTFAATVNALEWSNITPVFCDVDEKTMNINPDCIEKLITPKTTAIMPVHVFGVPCDVEKIEEIAKRHNLKVIYDAAHAFGVKVNGVPIGSFGDITMFSFHATKVYHTIEGGGLSFSSTELKRQADLLRSFGIEDNGDIAEPGINAKMNEFQAAMGLLMLDELEHEVAKRQKLTNLYRSLLKDVSGITVSEEVEGVTYKYPYFVIRVDAERYGMTRDQLFEKLKHLNIFARKYFYPLCSNFTCYQSLPSADKNLLPVANRIAESVLALPLYGALGASEVKDICRAIKELRP